MAIDVAEVRRIAALAHLRLGPAEEKTLARELARILDYIEVLRAVPTEGVPAMTHPVPLPDALDADEPRPGLAREAVLSEAPEADRARGLFRIPRVV